MGAPAGLRTAGAQLHLPLSCACPPLQVARRILMGTYALSAGYYEAYYKRAQQVILSRWSLFAALKPIYTCL